VRQFKAAKKTLGGLDAATVEQMVTACADLALILDKKGIIRDLAIDEQDFAAYGCGGWIGQPWSEVVSPDSRVKVEEMIAAAASDIPPRWRQINHPGGDGSELPISYSTLRLNPEGNMIAVGRDFRPLAVLQQRLVGTQARLEREYNRMRAVETRYQTLFQLSAEAVIVLDAATMKIAEANPAATRLLANGTQRIIGKSFLDLVSKDSIAAAQALLGELRVSARAEDITIQLGEGGGQLSLSAAMFRHESAAFYLLRLASVGNGDAAVSQPTASSPLFGIIAAMPDGFIIVDESRRILMANAAFLELAQLGSEEQARGEPIERWLGRVDVDIDVLIANLREYGFARRFPTVMRGEFGARDEIELSGVAVLGGDPPCYGLTIRRMPQPLSATAVQVPALPRSFEQLKELVGRVPLRDLVREATDIIEQMCIEAALELTGDNRASAAEMLGLSRQSLYVKLRRHGLGELDRPETA
jgi:transcriptional regulator PpsR